MLFLTNPRHKRKRTRPRVRRKRRSRFKKGSLAAKRYMASIRPKSKRRRTVRRVRRRRKVAVARRAPMARRKRRVTHRRRRVSVRRRRVYSANPHRKRRRRTYRRNPSMRGVVGTAKQAVKDAAGIITGKVIVNGVSKMIPGATQPGALGLAIKAALAVAGGWAGHKFIGPNAGRMIAAGGIAAVAETALVTYNVPFVSAALSGDDEVALLSGYPQIPGVISSGGLSPVGSGMSGYPSLSGIDAATADEVDLMSMYG